MTQIWRKRFTVTTALITYIIPAGTELIIYNHGTANIYVDFDQTIDVNNSFRLDAGLSLTQHSDVRTLYMQAVADTATVSVKVRKHSAS